MTPREEVILALKEEPTHLDATRLIKPAGIRLLSDTAVGYFRRSKAWMVQTDAPSKSAAERAGKTAQANLVPKTKLAASDPYLHQLDLYVTYQAGWVKLDGLPEKAKQTSSGPSVSEQKDQILARGNEVFGPKSTRITGSEGRYTLAITPTRKELRGKVRGGSVSADTLAGLREKLDGLITKVAPLLPEVRVASRFLAQ